MHRLHIYNGKLNANTEKYNFLFFFFFLLYIIEFMFLLIGITIIVEIIFKIYSKIFTS